MRKLLLYMGFVLVALPFGAWNCSKSFVVAPLAVAPNTPTPTLSNTPTPTDTPCGFPGNTCTPTFTATFSFTPVPTNTYTPTRTSTPTNSWTPSFTPTLTFTPTITFTPTPFLNQPQGVIGYENGGYPLLLWQVDPSAAVTGYTIFYSTTGTTGSYSALATVGKITGADTMAVTANVTTFNYYFYVEAIGPTLPNSAPSSVVHANSSPAPTTNGLVISVTNSTTPVITVSGSVAGAALRTYQIPQVYPVYYWYWSDQGNPLSSTVTYGASPPGGLTYVPAASLPAATNGFSVTVMTFNSQNWVLDTSVGTFNTP